MERIQHSRQRVSQYGFLYPAIIATVVNGALFAWWFAASFNTAMQSAGDLNIDNEVKFSIVAISVMGIVICFTALFSSTKTAITRLLSLLVAALLIAPIFLVFALGSNA